MACTLRAQHRHALVARIVVALIVSAAFLAIAPVAAEIFTCVAKDGSPLYQNFPCHIDSLGFLQTNSPVSKTPPIAGREKSKTEPVKVTSAVKSRDTSEPRIGMSSDEVRALLGEPEEMVEDEPASGGRVSIWRYADGRSVQFDNKHRVLAVQR